MTINPTSSITDMAAHLNAKPTVVGPKSDEYKKARQAAKPVSFSQHQSEPITDGMTSSAIFRTYQSMQREDFQLCIDMKGKEVPPLTPKQLEVARMMWSARVRHKVEASAKADELRAPSVKCQGLWADPDENL